MRKDLLRNLDCRSKFDPTTGTLIIGASGYIGSLLSTAIGAREIASTLYSSDVRKILHLAGSPVLDFKQARELSSLTFALSDFARDNAVDVIYMSTNNVYPFGHVSLETTPDPNSLYGFEKALGEMILARDLLTNLEIWRLADVFGVGQKHGNFFRALELNAYSGSYLKLSGKGSKRRSYVWAEDLVSSLVSACQSDLQVDKASATINVCYEDSMSNAEIASQWSRFFGLNVVVDPETIEDSSVRVMDPGANGLFGAKKTSDALLEYFRSIEKETI
jgi:nucleoside-diphosphate-sugar epimerase